MSVPLKAFVAEEVLKAFCVVGIIVSVSATLGRTLIRLKMMKRLQADDYILFAALVVQISLCALYLADCPPLYRFFGVASGEEPMYPGLADDYAQMMRISFAVTSFFWTTLWGVKYSILFFFRSLVKGTPHMKRWWFIFAFTGITFVGCIVSEFTSCEHLSEFTTLGECVSKPEQRAQIISLYYSLAADLISDLLIMALPLSILPSLQIPRQHKYGLAAIFGVGIICMVFAIVRVVQIQDKTGISTPSTAWLGLWAVVETTVAIVVGCLPAYAQFIRKRQVSSTYGHGVVNYNSSSSTASRARKESVRLTSMKGLGSNTKVYSDARHNASSSEEQILELEKGIRVSTKVEYILGERENE